MVCFHQKLFSCLPGLFVRRLPAVLDAVEFIQIHIQSYVEFPLLLGVAQETHSLHMARYVDFDVSGSVRSRK